MNKTAKVYRTLASGDIITIGDEWYNPDWEVDGPWYQVKPGNRFIGTKYDPQIMRPMRRTP